MFISLLPLQAVNTGDILCNSISGSLIMLDTPWGINLLTEISIFSCSSASFLCNRWTLGASYVTEIWIPDYIRYPLMHQLLTRDIFNFRFISQLPLQAVSTGGILCDNIPGLIGKQRRMCRLHQTAMYSIRKGAKEGVKECQFQFRKHRWNCSTLDRDASVFGKVLLKGNSFIFRYI